MRWIVHLMRQWDQHLTSSLSLASRVRHTPTKTGYIQEEQSLMPLNLRDKHVWFRFKQTPHRSRLLQRVKNISGKCQDNNIFSITIKKASDNNTLFRNLVQIYSISVNYRSYTKDSRRKDLRHVRVSLSHAVAISDIWIKPESLSNKSRGILSEKELQ